MSSSVESPPPLTPAAIKALRARKQVSQTMFGILVGVSVMTVSRWERGVVSPAPRQRKRLQKLAEGGAANG